MLNVVSEIFYLFEPLILGMGDEQNEIEKKQEVLQRIIGCNLPLYSQFKIDSTPDFVQHSCSERDFCFAQETKQFCQQPFCNKDSTGDQVRLIFMDLQIILSRFYRPGIH